TSCEVIRLRRPRATSLAMYPHPARFASHTPGSSPGQALPAARGGIGVCCLSPAQSQQNDTGSNSQNHCAELLDDRFHETGRHGPCDSFVDSSFVSDRTRSGIMAKWRQAVELAMTDEEIDRLAAIARSRSEPACRVERARMLLAYCESPSFYAVGQRLG